MTMAAVRGKVRKFVGFLSISLMFFGGCGDSVEVTPTLVGNGVVGVKGAKLSTAGADAAQASDIESADSAVGGAGTDAQATDVAVFDADIPPDAVSSDTGRRSTSNTIGPITTPMLSSPTPAARKSLKRPCRPRIRDARRGSVAPSKIAAVWRTRTRQHRLMTE